MKRKYKKLFKNNNKKNKYIKKPKKIILQLSSEESQIISFQKEQFEK